MSASIPTLDTIPAKRSWWRYLPGLRPNVFRVAMAVGIFALSLAMHLKLGQDGVLPALDATAWTVSVVLGALAYWLAETLVFFLVAFCPVVAIAALLAALYGWLAQ